MIGRWFFALIGTFFSIMPAFVYLLAGSLIIGGDTNVSIGTIVAFTTLQSRLFFPLGQLLNVQVEIQGALALFDRIFEYLEMEHEIARRARCRRPVDRPPCAATSGSTTSRSATRWPPAQLEVAPEAAEAEAEGRAVPTAIQPFALTDIDVRRRARGSWSRWSGRRAAARPPPPT